MRKLKELRERKNITQQELANIVGLKSGEAICQYENGKRKPSLVLIPKLAEALNCEISELFEE